MRRSFEDYADLIREWEKAQEELKNLAAIVERLEDVTATAVRLSDQVHAVRNVIRKWEPSGTAIAAYICADLREIVLKEDDDA